MQSTIVKVKCISKKERNSYNIDFPIATEIELEVPYDMNSIYHKMSGGTNMVLNTVNQGAADMFKLNAFYDLTISPSAPEETK